MTVSEGLPAIAGGRPVRTTPLPYSRPIMGAAEEEAALRVIRSGWLTTGPETQAFEAELAAAGGARHAVAVSSCTAALHLAFATLPRAGDVITTSFTFASSIAAIRYAGLRPVLVDVREDDLTIDPDLVARAITERTVAVLGIDYGGSPIRIDELRAAIAGRPIALVEDAAHSIGARIGPRPVGGLADATCFSFYANKNITTGEGGALMTDDDAVAASARQLRLHGMNADAWKRYLPGGAPHYDIERLGFKYNLTDLASAIGRVQLGREPELRARRRAVAETYERRLVELEPLVKIPRERAGTTHAWHLYPLRLDPDRLAIARDAFVAAMRDEGVACSIHFSPVHLFAAYRDTAHASSLERTEAAGRNEVSLPIWPGMVEEDAGDVVEAVRKIVRHYAR